MALLLAIGILWPFGASSAGICPQAQSAYFESQQIKRLLSSFESNLQEMIETSGFRSVEELSAAADRPNEGSTQDYRQAKRILETEDFRVGIRLSARMRGKVATDGILNSYQVGHSQGAFIGRATVEAAYAGMTKEDYDALPVQLKPKYAALYPSEGSSLKPTTALDYFAGGDIFYLKKERIKNRTTLTAGDSHNRYTYMHGYFYTDVKPAKAWDQLFLPWQDRALLIPLIARGLQFGKLGDRDIIKPTNYMSPGEFGAQWAIEGEGPMANYKLSWDPNMDYVEAQVWGRINLDDVETFEYSGAEPKGKFLAELQRRGIKIRKRDP